MSVVATSPCGALAAMKVGCGNQPGDSSYLAPASRCARVPKSRGNELGVEQTVEADEPRVLHAGSARGLTVRSADLRDPASRRARG
jgi:hypothetical protein